MSDTKAGSAKEEKTLDVVVVGAGFAGVYLLHRLREAGFSTLVVEAANDVGGTWYWNRYPGARCDVQSLEYSYSFSEEIQQRWTWRERYATQPEILSYIQHVADTLDLRRDILFDTRVKSALFDKANARWQVETENGKILHARYCIMATGNLSSSRLPNIAGIQSFEGEIFHTGRWPHAGVDLSGKRVGVIGTGSSGIQVIPQIANQASHLFVFQRTPNYSVPAQNAPLAADYVEKWKADYPALRARARATRSGVLYEYGTRPAHETPAEEREVEFERRWRNGGSNFLYAYNDIVRHPESNEAAASFVRAKIDEIVDDPETARKLTPIDYPIGTKRICVDTDYFATFNRANVSLVDLRDEPIETITAGGVTTSAGQYDIDVLVFATGFDAMTGALLAMDIRTTEGSSLREAWRAGPQTYLGLAVAGLPNLFIITGPGSPSVLSNMVVSIEHDVEWIAECLAAMRRQGIPTIEAEVQAQEDWVAHVNEVAAGTLYSRGNSWYLGANIPGKPRVFMPYLGGVDVYQRKCREVAEDGYRGFTLG